MDFKRKPRIKESPVGELYIAGMLLTNLSNCVYPNTVSQYFGCTPFGLGEYLSSDTQ